MGFLDNLFGNSSSSSPSWFGNQGIVGNLVGGLGTAASIYGLYNQNQTNQENLSWSHNFQTQQAAEQQHEFQQSEQLKEQELSQAAAAQAASAAAAQAAVAAQVQAAHSHAIQGAYDTLIRSVESGDAGKASILSGLIDKFQRAYERR